MQIRLWAASLAAFTLSGCAFFLEDRIHYTWSPDAGTPCADCLPTETGSTIIGVALSGGGSRASVYGAAALEIFAEAGILDQTTYLSSVSGGGFPAAYYALKQPQVCADETACNTAGFETFKAAMRHDFLGSMTVRQIEKPNRISSPTRRLSSLQDVLDEQFVGGAGFGDLPTAPVLLINGARYDDARRFVFSNVAIPEAQSGERQFSEATLRTASFSQPGCARPTPRDFPVSLAVAISAGFPPLLGPAAFEMSETCTGGAPLYWHLGDGGILDNTGVETIEDYALHAATSGQPVKRVIIFSVDAGRSTSPDDMMDQRNLKLWTTDPGRVVDIVGKRAEAYRQVALDQLARDAGVEFTIIKMRYTDAELSAWPVSCGENEDDRSAIREALATVPTNLRITDCNADLMELAAEDVVRRAIADHRDLIDDVLNETRESGS